ncbi:MAG TPA: DUF1588 domain-containing protein [Polyangiaceae bacterium]|jgi:hypothetical protein
MKPWAWSVVPLVALVAACQGHLGSKARPGNPANAGGSSSGGDGSGGSSGTNPGGGTAGAGMVEVSCTTPNLGSPVLRLLNGREFNATITTLFPPVDAKTWTNSLPADPVSAYGFDNDSSTVVGPQLAQALLDTATSFATAVTTNALSTMLPCSATSPDRTCADTFIKQYGRRLFRRALTTDEENRYLAFFDADLPKADFKTVIKWIMVGLIQSPNAVYRSEIGTVANGVRQLSPLEIATELAYTYTGTTPTDDLLTKAEGGTLGDYATLAAQLLTPTVMHRFFEAYFQYPQVGAIERDPPNFDAVRSDMILETRAFINDIVVTHLGGLKELLTTNTTNPSPALATYYQNDAPNFPAQPAAADPSTGFFPAVTRPAGLGIGILAHGSFLANRALPNSSSPTQRGLFVFSRLLCETKPNPPAGVPPIGNPEPGVHTTRYRYEMEHANGGTCGACHQRFDPIGFGFEHFDEGGRYRQTEDGLTIDTASDVPAPVLTSPPPALFQFQDEETLAQGLAAQPLVYQCFAAYLAIYAFGSGESCIGESKVADFQSGNVGIAQYFVDLAGEPHFSQRSSQ